MYIRASLFALSSSTFSRDALSITLTVNNTVVVWHPGDVNTGNLGGTRLDVGCYATFETCYGNGLSEGPVSELGWSMLDDSAGIRMDTVDNADVGFPWYKKTNTHTLRLGPHHN